MALEPLHHHSAPSLSSTMPSARPPHGSQGNLIQASTILAVALVLFVLVARALTVAPLVLVANLWRPKACRISLREGTVVWWAGAMRGASEWG